MIRHVTFGYLISWWSLVTPSRVTWWNELGDFKGVRHFEAKVWVEGSLWTLDRLHYNSAARRFHTKKLCSRLYSIKVAFYLKHKNRFLSHPLGDIGVMYTLHL